MYSEMSQPTYVCFPRRRRRSETNLKIVLEQELSRQVAEAVTELLQVLCCGEESAVFAFSSLSRNRTLNADASSCTATIAREEAFHDELLRGLRGVLPSLNPISSSFVSSRNFTVPSTLRICLFTSRKSVRSTPRFA